MFNPFLYSYRRMWNKWRRDGIRRQRNALCDSTWRNYMSAFKLFFAFCMRFSINPLHCNLTVFTTFTQMLIQQKLKCKNIINILTGVNTCCNWMRINTGVINSIGWIRNIQSLERTVRERPRLQSSLSLQHLVKLVTLINDKPKWSCFKVLLLFGFFGLLRLSNLTSKTRTRIDKDRNTLVNDVCITKFGLVIKLKWTKTRQKGNRLALVPLPKIKNSVLCPQRAWMQYKQTFKEYCKHPNNILLTLDGSTDNILTASKARKLLHELTRLTNLELYKYTPHNLRRGGAVFLYQNGISTSDIRRHGLWTSQCVDTYLRETMPRASRVVHCFATNCANL